MVLASHVIIGHYGFWLPNDERGSWSDFVGSWDFPACVTRDATCVSAVISLREMHSRPRLP